MQDRFSPFVAPIVAHFGAEGKMFSEFSRKSFSPDISVDIPSVFGYNKIVKFGGLRAVFEV
jgi:hypothetical protein